MVFVSTSSAQLHDRLPLMLPKNEFADLSGHLTRHGVDSDFCHGVSRFLNYRGPVDGRRCFGALSDSSMIHAHLGRKTILFSSVSVGFLIGT